MLCVMKSMLHVMKSMLRVMKSMLRVMKYYLLYKGMLDLIITSYKLTMCLYIP